MATKTDAAAAAKASRKAAKKSAAKTAAKKSAPKAKAKSEKRTPEHKGAQPNTGTSESAGVGNKAHPGNQRVPEGAVIRREPLTEQGMKVTESAEVQGNKALQIIDIRNSRPVHVSLIKGMGLTKDADGRMLAVTNNVVTNLVPVVNANGLFAIKKDGTVIYNHGGFDDVPGNTEFDMLDIVKLIEHNNG